jgi:hypothetical protein
VADDSCSACAAPLDSIDAAKIATMNSIVPRDRNAAIVLAAVKGEALARGPGGRPGRPLRAPAVRVLADGGMVRALTEQRNDGRHAILRQGHSSSPVQRGSAVPMIALVGSAPKYRPSNESADRQFMRKISPSAMMRQACQTGSGRPRPSRALHPSRCCRR